MKVEVTISVLVELAEGESLHEFHQSMQYQEFRSDIQSAINQVSYLRITDCVFMPPVPKGSILNFD